MPGRTGHPLRNRQGAGAGVGADDGMHALDLDEAPRRRGPPSPDPPWRRRPRPPRAGRTRPPPSLTCSTASSNARRLSLRDLGRAAAEIHQQPDLERDGLVRPRRRRLRRRADQRDAGPRRAASRTHAPRKDARPAEIADHHELPPFQREAAETGSPRAPRRRRPTPDGRRALRLGAKRHRSTLMPADTVEWQSRPRAPRIRVASMPCLYP